MPSHRPKKTRNQARPADQPAAGERLQKVLAAAGLGSRRKCEELIVEGRVEVDRQVASLGTRVNALTQEIRVDGEALRKPRAVYFIVNKPPGVLSTNYDPEYRVRVVDLVKSSERLFTVGRLDQYSEGLILVTNDGDLANRLTHPRYGATKTYHVVVAGSIEQRTLDRMERGVHLAEGIARVASLKVKKHHPQSTELEMVLEEGKNREIRRVFAAVGHKVLRLRRTQIGPIKLGDLPVGAHRPLTKEELEKLQVYAYASRKKEVKPKRRAAATATGERSTPPAYQPPLIDESDDDFEEDFATGPVLVDEDLIHFDEGPGDDSFQGRRPGAVIAFADDDEVAAPPPATEKRAPGKFSKKARRSAEEKGKKKFARRTPRGAPAAGDKSRGAATGARAGKKFAKGARGHAETPRSPGGPKKYGKKQARRKGRS